jgi:hypothetical protein
MPEQDPDREVTPKGEALDPDRAMQEASRRAAAMIRRWCVANEASRLGTLTYRCRRCNRPDGCICAEGSDRPTLNDWDQVVEDIARFRRAVRERIGRDVPILTVIEPHKDGSLHVHFCFNRYLRKDVLRGCWPHGFVDLRLLRAKVDAVAAATSTGRRQRCRIVAFYLSSYLKKSFHESHQMERKRYSTTRGFAPCSRSARALRRPAAVALASLTFSGPLRWWSSDDLPKWDHPPVMVGYLDDSG